MIYDVDNPHLTGEIHNLRKCLSLVSDDDIVNRCVAQRDRRLELWNEGTDQTVCGVLFHEGYLLNTQSRRKLSSKLHSRLPLTGNTRLLLSDACAH